jgi:adenylosuccinate synthase
LLLEDNVDSERSLTIVGGQWGDEGKGKVVDLLSAGYPVVVRFNGGHNAGHTVRFADRRFALHLVPSGVIHDGVTCYLAAGMVIDPSFLVTEIDRLNTEGIATEGRVFVSPRVTHPPTHQALDGVREQARDRPGSALLAAESALPTRISTAARLAPICSRTAGGWRPRPAR